MERSMNAIQDLPEGEQYVLIRLSGGADSSILYYALCDKFKDRDDVKIVVVTLDTNVKNQSIASTKKIIEIVGSLTGKYPVDHITNTVKDNSEEYITGQEQLDHLACTKYPIVKTYSGLTKNPPLKNLINFIERNSDKGIFDLCEAHNSINSRDRSRDEDFKFDPSADMSGFVFSNHDKRFVAKTYLHYNMMEKLYPYTFSCVSPPYKFEKDMPIHCGYCFPCLERWYAFGRIV